MFGALLREEVAEEVDHCLWTFTVGGASVYARYQGLLTDDRIELLDSWKSGHTGFSAHNAVTVRAGDHGGLERLARYLLRPPLSLERLTLEPGLARYCHKRAPGRRGEPFDPAELLARLVMHIPAPRLRGRVGVPGRGAPDRGLG